MSSCFALIEMSLELPPSRYQGGQSVLLNHSDIDCFWVLSHPCILGITPTWSPEFRSLAHGGGRLRLRTGNVNRGFLFRRHLGLRWYRGNQSGFADCLGRSGSASVPQTLPSSGGIGRMGVSSLHVPWASLCSEVLMLTRPPHCPRSGQPASSRVRAVAVRSGSVSGVSCQVPCAGEWPLVTPCLQGLLSNVHACTGDG